MDWTPIIVAVITIVPATFVAAMSWRASYHNGRKVDSVHGIVNSQRAEMTAKIEDLMERIVTLENTIAVYRDHDTFVITERKKKPE